MNLYLPFRWSTKFKFFTYGFISSTDSNYTENVRSGLEMRSGNETVAVKVSMRTQFKTIDDHLRVKLLRMKSFVDQANRTLRASDSHKT